MEPPPLADPPIYAKIAGFKRWRRVVAADESKWTYQPIVGKQ